MKILGGNLLKNEVERIKEYLTEFKESWSKTGCTIMSDGWTDQRSPAPFLTSLLLALKELCSLNQWMHLIK
jgi:hypothetical protein